MSETRKVVINACHGGFGLSWAAMQKIAERKGLVASYFDMSPDIRMRLGQPEPEPDELFVNRVVGPHAVTSWKGMKDNDAFLFDSNILRDDPDLVAVVEDLGSEKASARFAQLAIAEVPSDAEWEIEEYDGSEWVAEKHRTWHA